MNMQIGDGWRVYTDDHNFILEQQHTVQVRDKETHKPSGETKEAWKIFGYFSKLEHAMTSLLQQEMLDHHSELTALELIALVKRTEHNILQAIREGVPA